MAPTQETTLDQWLDGVTSWTIVALTFAYASLMANAPVIMTIGGLVLLGLRLYVDGRKAWDVFRGKKHD